MAHDSKPSSRDPPIDCADVRYIVYNDFVVYADLKRERSNIPELVAVSGAAWAEKPLKCELSDRQAVLTEVTDAELLWISSQ